MSVEKDVKKKRLIAEIKAQYPNMSEEILKALSQYSVDDLADVRTTMKADRDKFEFVVRGYEVTMSGGDGKPFNVEVIAPDGSIVRSSQGDKRSSVASLGEDGKFESVTQVNHTTQEMSYQDGDGTQIYAQKKGNKAYLKASNNDAENGAWSVKSKVTSSGDVRTTFDSEDAHLKLTKNDGKISAEGVFQDGDLREINEYSFQMRGESAKGLRRTKDSDGNLKETEVFSTDGSYLYTREYSPDEENRVKTPKGIINRDKGSTYVERENSPQGETADIITTKGGSFLKTDERDGGLVCATKEERTISVLDIVKNNKGYGK